MVPRPLLTLTAQTIDPFAVALLRAGARPRVHSVFGRALNVVTSTGDLLAVVGPHVGGAPGTIVLERLPDVGFDATGIVPDLPADVTPERMLIGAQLRVDLRRVVLWQPALAVRTLPHKDVLARVAIAESLAAGTAPSGGLAPLLPWLDALTRLVDPAVPDDLDPLCQAAWAGTKALVCSWPNDNRNSVRAALLRLVGLGPGATPSGDDLLTGLFVATHRLRGGLPDGLGETCLAIARERSTDLSVARILHAARGAIEETQERVLVELVGGAGANLQGAVAKAARYGHTSGIDTLVGLFLGTRLAMTSERHREPGVGYPLPRNAAPDAPRHVQPDVSCLLRPTDVD